MKKFSLTISLLFLLSSLSSFASESNLDNFTYPPHECGEKVKKPKKAAQLSTFENVDDYNNAIIEYNIQVADYNKIIRNYKSCINQYIQNGNHDINIIRKELNKALKEARARPKPRLIKR